jgi:hypothetical protein
VPDPSSENVTIPDGFSVLYNLGDDLNFENATVFTICGTITMSSRHLHMKDDSYIEICPTGIFTGHEIKLEGDGCINYTGASNKYTNSGSGGIFNCFDPTYGVCDLGLVTLPVELKIVENDVVVSWETLSETNNSHFEVWLGSDLGDFNLVKVVEGQGNSTEINRYTVGFTPDLAGVLYIKLRQVDYNSDYQDADIKSLFYAPSFSIENIVLYPNPSNRYISLKNLIPDEDYQLSIYSNDGKLLSSTKVDSNDNTVDITSLKMGAYYVIVTDSIENKFSIRFVKIE